MSSKPRPARLLALTVEDDAGGSGFRWVVLENQAPAAEWVRVQRADTPAAAYAEALRLGSDAMDRLRTHDLPHPQSNAQPVDAPAALRRSA